MRMLFLAAVFAAAPAFADEGWVALGAADADAALRSRTLRYEDGATQDFHPDGGTTYTVDGTPSEGRWGIRDGRYCSVWPTSERWACYDLARSAGGLDIRFTDGGGGETIGRYVDAQ